MVTKAKVPARVAAAMAKRKADAETRVHMSTDPGGRPLPEDAPPVRRVYVAASVYDLERARDIAGILRAMGLTIVSDWHDKVMSVRERDCEDELPIDVRRERAAHNFACVDKATDLLLVSSSDAKGALVEYGYALAKGIHVWFLGAHHTLMTTTATPFPPPPAVSWEPADVVARIDGKTPSGAADKSKPPHAPSSIEDPVLFRKEGHEPKNPHWAANK